MSAPSSSFARRALAAVLVALVLVLAGATATAASDLDRQAPSTEPGSTPPTASGTSAPAPATGVADPEAPVVDDAVDEAAQDAADADLWAVWQVVIALVVVAVALLALLLLYVRATSPRRARGAPVPLLADADPLLTDPALADGDLADEQDEEWGPSADGGAEALVPAATVAVGTEDTGPAPAPERRVKRVEAPAKKLATPDAERVLVRPGQAPIRVPAVPAPGARTDGRPPPAPTTTPPSSGPPSDDR